MVTRISIEYYKLLDKREPFATYSTQTSNHAGGGVDACRINNKSEPCLVLANAGFYCFVWTSTDNKA